MRFRQSVTDFPLMVELGNKAPSWGLSRWGGNSGLRFVPLDDEGFTLRGDKRRLVYKGRCRSHRFTILGDGAFEYDCILEREPDSNVISLLMEGAENFDFFRQPDFVSDPFLKGSYAVYKKETLLGEGTGKLCHIHRPEIIDARGRRCWGDLSVVGNCLCISVPEKWLSEAAYPVLVDPTVGTNTIGSQTHWYDEDNEQWDRLYFDHSMAVNRFRIPENLSGTATAFVYAYHADFETPCKPVLYSDNNNVPHTRLSVNERDLDLEVRGGKPAGWRSANFAVSGNITSGSNVWFGISTVIFHPRFDYGMKCYWEFWDHLNTQTPDTFPVWSANWFYDFRLSMYFTYSSAQNYIRTITQGVSLNDKQITSGNYRRGITETAGVRSAFAKIGLFFRNCIEAAYTVTHISRLPVFIRKCVMSVNAATRLSRWRSVMRVITEQVKAEGNANGGMFFTVRIVTRLFVRDYLLRRFLKARKELVLKSKVIREIELNSRIV